MKVILLVQMYEKMHILSPLVAPREFFFIRYCQQVHSNTWMMVDLSYDFMKEPQDDAPTRSWKLPSGCMIEQLPNGNSFVSFSIDRVEQVHEPTFFSLFLSRVNYNV